MRMYIYVHVLMFATDSERVCPREGWDGDGVILAISHSGYPLALKSVIVSPPHIRHKQYLKATPYSYSVAPHDDIPLFSEWSQIPAP